MDNIFGLKNHPARSSQLSRDDRTQAHGLGKLPVGTSRFCLARLDENDNLFMTGGSAWPPPSLVKPKKIYLYR